MKKYSIIFIFLAAATSLHAQLSVKNNGHVTVGTTTANASAIVSAGEAHTYAYGSSYNFGLLSNAQTGSNCIAIKGTAWATSGSANSIGVQGIAGGGQSGRVYGVLGALGAQTNGAGIFGTTTTNHLGVNVNGVYAGYFNGEVYVSGDITATHHLTPSDMRLKENVTYLSDSNTESSALENILGLNVIKYNYNDLLSATGAVDTAVVVSDRSNSKEMHYGLSAQELQLVYPDLVREGQDGYLAVNYIELVPILIRSIQELKQELDEMKGGAVRTRSITDVSKAVCNQHILYQNTPNPYKEQTVIRFSLADDVKDAAICIFDMTGKTIKRLPISSGMESVSVGGYELGEGIFLYSLIVNGQEIDTKKMVISKQ